MKYIIGIIQPDRIDDVLERLTEKEIHLVTVSNVIGRGRQQGIAEVYRSHKEPGRSNSREDTQGRLSDGSDLRDATHRPAYEYG